jgi:hypothetical protein
MAVLLSKIMVNREEELEYANTAKSTASARRKRNKSEAIPQLTDIALF